ncbi:hypothetical protein ACTFIV_009584 [Dictyostelium citrinum]
MEETNSVDINISSKADGASSPLIKRGSYKPNSENPRRIIMFDGVCNVCDGFVQFVFPRDVGKRFSFQALQTEKGKEILDYYGIPCDMSSIILVDEADGKHYTKSTAVLNILFFLKAPYSYFYSFYFIPPIIRDLGYDFFATYRYLILGKKDSCFFSPSMASRFICFESKMIDINQKNL